MKFLIAFLAVILVAVAMSAEPEICYEFRMIQDTPAGSWHNQGDSAILSDVLAYCNGTGSWSRTTYRCAASNYNKAAASCTFTPGTMDADASPNWPISHNCVLISGGTFLSSGTVAVNLERRTDPDGCPVDPCAELAGQNRIVSSAALDSTGCDSGCAMSVPESTLIISASGWSGNLAEASYTGVSCDDEPPVTKSNCVMSYLGKVCATAQTGQNCGVYNGENICVESVPSGCKSTASGGVACKVEGDGAVDEDLLPNDGESPPGPADPDMVVEKDGDVVNYYSNSTVNNSTTTTPTGEGDPAGEGDIGGEEGEGEGEPGEGSEGGDGVLPDAFEELDSFGSLTEGFMGRVAESPLVSSVTDLGDNVPAGSCPDWSIEVFDQEISLSAPMCTIWSTIAGALSAIMLIAWALLAARILLSA